MKTVVFICFLVTLLYLVSCCDEDTHYWKQDKCCKKCGPGKRMLKDDNCDDPRCQDCLDGEYQSGFTSDTKCERQPSCDPNLHFQPQMNPSKTSLSKCQCEAGYYCTQEDDCDTCRKRTVCKAGERVLIEGSQFGDTVCEPCKNGTFSTHESAVTCKEWTICEHGFDKNAPGSSTSDRICVDDRRAHRGAVVVGVVALLLILIGIAATLYFTKGNKCWKELHKHFNKGRSHEHLDVEKPIYQQPVEVDEPVSPSPSNVTENGNVVEQERGKEPVYPSAESNSYSYSYS